MRGFTSVYCSLSDCLYYTPEPGFPRKCRCTHPDKPTVMSLEKCPLYRLDWQSKAAELSPTPQKPKVFPTTKKRDIKKYGKDEE